jgi:hypothetical protein
VLAFKVQKLQLRDGELTTAEEASGPYFGANDEVQEVVIEFDAALDQCDVDGMEAEAVHDELPD